MQKSLFDPGYMDALDKQVEHKKKTNSKGEVFSSPIRSVFEEHPSFLEEKKRFEEKRKIWRRNFCR